MLYAGTTPLFSFKHSILNDTVKELKQWSQSAGNNFVNQNGTSETLRNETVVKTENVKLISDHVPKHLKPVNDESFGHYLAGLIEGSGQFNSTQQLVQLMPRQHCLSANALPVYRLVHYRQAFFRLSVF